MSAAEMAAAYGLKQMGVRPPLFSYVRDVWQRRHFVRSLATSKAYSENQNTYLGQLWALLNPALNALVYVIIFGIVLKTNRGVSNVSAFIVVGTFMFGFFSSSVTAGAKSVKNNLNLVRSLHFPRAVLPLSTVLAQLASLLPALFVMAIFVLATGLLPGSTPVQVSWRWLLIIPAVVLLYIFNTGVAFMVARATARMPDILNTLPFVLRMLMYASGVLFSIDHYISDPILAQIMAYQPVAIFLDVSRQAVLSEASIPLDASKWVWALGWALVTFVVGFVFFWRDEGRYGRD